MKFKTIREIAEYMCSSSVTKPKKIYFSCPYGSSNSALNYIDEERIMYYEVNRLFSTIVVQGKRKIFYFVMVQVEPFYQGESKTVSIVQRSNFNSIRTFSDYSDKFEYKQDGFEGKIVLENI